MRLCPLCLLALLIAAPSLGSGPGQARAQVPGSCDLGFAEGELDIGDVHARVFNTGSLFFNSQIASAYLVPRQTGRSPLFAAGLWVGGLVDGELRVAGATYFDFEFWPGPLLPGAVLPDSTDCSDYDRIWRVSRADIADYFETGVPAPDLAEWPAHLGAPVLDGDGDPTNYDLVAGDQPAISGDQTLWWVMNDTGGPHLNSLTPPIGLEVQVTAFAFAQGPAALAQSTFYRYRLVNRSAAPLDSAYVSLFADVDLGDAADDYVGVDTLHGLGFVYNADNADGDGSGTTYGTPPPAFGIQFLEGLVGLPDGRAGDRDGRGAAGGRTGLSAFMYFTGGYPFPQVDPNDGRQIYFIQQGRWVDGTPLTIGGDGLNPGSTDTTTFAFPGDPVTGQFWSERCPGSPVSCGGTNSPGDRRFAMSTGPFRFEAGASEEILLAMPFGQGSDPRDSVTELRRAAIVIRNALAAGYLDPRPVPGHVRPQIPPGVELRRPAPNPFSDEAVMSITLPAAAGVRVALVDVLGREVAVLADGPHEAGPHPIEIAGTGLAPGVYVARVWVNGQQAGALPITRR